MKKKLIRTIASLTCGLGIVASIPSMISSCGSSSGEKPAVDPKSIDINWTGDNTQTFNWKVKSSLAGSYSATVSPADASQEVKWSIVNDNDNVAYIDGGLIYIKETANVGEHEFDLRATSVVSTNVYSDKHFKIEIQYVEPQSISIVWNAENIYETEINQAITIPTEINATLMPENADPSIEYSITEESAEIVHKVTILDNHINISAISVAGQYNFKLHAGTINPDVYDEKQFTINVKPAEISDDAMYSFDSTTKTITGFASTFDWSSFTSDTIVIPAEINSVPVEAIAEDAFSDGKLSSHKISNVDFSQATNLVAIGDNAFINSGMTNDVNLNSCRSLQTIGERVFERVDCKQVEMSECNNLKIIGRLAFAYCYSLKNVTLPINLETMGDGVFVNCSLFESCEISDQNEHMGYATNVLSAMGIKAIIQKSADGSCNWTNSSAVIAGIYFDDGNTFDLTKISNITQIAESAFKNCNMSGIVFPTSLTQIGRYAFHSVVFGNADINLVAYTSVKIDGYAFSYSNVKSLSFKGASIRIADDVLWAAGRLDTINWYGLSSDPSSVFSSSTDALHSNSKNGKVYLYNPLSGYTSSKLLEFLKTKGLDSSWRIGN